MKYISIHEGHTFDTYSSFSPGQTSALFFLANFLALSAREKWGFALAVTDGTKYETSSKLVNMRKHAGSAKMSFLPTRRTTGKLRPAI